jgi:hypothetical protein
MNKKKIEVVMKCADKDQLFKYFCPENNKILVINVFDKFWGPCEVSDSMIKRFIEAPENLGKVDFISVEKELTGETFLKYKFGSKPKYFISHVKIKF